MTFKDTRRLLPLPRWARGYRREQFAGDLTAGIITAIMLVPQGMAYALLAGLPPQLGLYASIVPPAVYGLLGGSRALAVGPVALSSMLTATAVAGLGSVSAMVAAAAVLALMVGVILLLLGLLRVGFLVNFLSHPVLSGFTTAAAIVIAISQLKHLTGLDVPRGLPVHETVVAIVGGLDHANMAALVLGLGSIALLLFFKSRLARLLLRLGMPGFWAGLIAKTGPLAVVLVSTIAVVATGLDDGQRLRIVGDIPRGLPSLTLPVFDPDLWRSLAPAAILIALIAFMESVSVAKALAARNREKIYPNQELVALGVANLGAGVTGAYPVAGGFGRSVVNFAAGARTPLASLITAGLVALAVLFLSPLFHSIPNTALAAIIIVAVSNLIDIPTIRETWRYNKADAASLAATFVAVLVIGIEKGIMIGVAVSLVLYLWRTSRPHMAVVGRVGTTEHFRNVLRHKVATRPHVVAVRVDESLYFANAGYLADKIQEIAFEKTEVKHVVLVCSAVNFIDASALTSLEDLIVELRAAGITLHLAEVKGPVMDRLKRSDLLEKLGEGRVFLSTHEAMVALGGP